MQKLLRTNFSVFRFYQFGGLISLLSAIASGLSFNYPALAQKACVRTDTGNTVCGDLVQTSGASTTPALNLRQSMQVQDNSFNFELQNCYRSGSSINCNLLVKNIGNIGAQLTLNVFDTPSRIITVSGEEIRPSALQLGRNKVSGRSSISRVAARLNPNLPLNLVLTFDNVSTQQNSLPALEIAYKFSNYGKSDNYSTVLFRDVLIQPN
ncbi:MAG: hypothetical protein WBB28_24380 [Crinalium sp.]